MNHRNHDHHHHQKPLDDDRQKATTAEMARGDYWPPAEQQQQQSKAKHQRQQHQQNQQPQYQRKQHLQTTKSNNSSTLAPVDGTAAPGIAAAAALRRSSAVVCRELCTSCRTRVNALVADQLGQPLDGATSGEDVEFHLFQTSMPENAVSAVKQKLIQLSSGLENKGEASLGQEVSGFIESQFGGAWNVILGEDFAASVIYGANSFMHCAVGRYSFLMFSWQPLKLFDSWSGATTERPY